MKFDFDDILITPETISEINSRKEVNPFDLNDMLPIMTAPMDTVIDINNASEFIWNNIYAITPRGTYTDEPTLTNNYKKWYSYGLDEFEKKFLPYKHRATLNGNHYALIDVANGSMKRLFETVKLAKEIYGDRLCLMIGNIANPRTYAQYASIGTDYVRCGIGGGQGCLTSVQTGVGYPMASLINECSILKTTMGFTTKIVADGGMNKYSDIVKALAIGADYVMLGSMLNKCLESSGGYYTQRYLGGFEKFDLEKYKKEVNQHTNDGYSDKKLLEKITIFKKYRGMSTKEVQEKWGKKEIKTSEGISKYNKVEYTLKGFTENLEDYLRSAMSYTGSENLEEFRHSRFVQITPASFNRFNK